MHKLLPLTRLPEWSEFFREALVRNQLHFQWREEEGAWVCRAWDFSRDLSRPLELIVLGEARRADPFDALAGAIEACGRAVQESVWSAFYAFRFAATGTPTTIEDLL